MNDAQTQLGVCASSKHLKTELTKSEPVRYTHNGNRTTDGPTFLSHIESLLPVAGITRVAEISQLSETDFPVFQSVRPNIETHSITGQNTGSQGKGRTEVQAKISCIMEALETYCAEPKELNLIRGSYDHVSKSHLAMEPQSFISRYTHEAIQLTEPIMWGEAYSVSLDDSVLVPASLIYFPFHPADYLTRCMFLPQSNGLASGATYLEAVIHGLYEVIERHYLCWEQQQGNDGQSLLLDSSDVLELANLQIDYGLTLSICLRKDVDVNMPFIVCRLGETSVMGFGCSSKLTTSLERAMSECLQSNATVISSSRENIARREAPVFPERFMHSQNIVGDCKASELTNRIVDRVFVNLKDEYEFICEWLSRQGFHQIYIANLTRVGIDIPVVKVIVPGLTQPIEMRAQYGKAALEFGNEQLIRYLFPNIKNEERKH